VVRESAGLELVGLSTCRRADQSKYLLVTVCTFLHKHEDHRVLLVRQQAHDHAVRRVELCPRKCSRCEKWSMNQIVACGKWSMNQIVACEKWSMNQIVACEKWSVNQIVACEKWSMNQIVVCVNAGRVGWRW
jgi:hypothetical protein